MKLYDKFECVIAILRANGLGDGSVRDHAFFKDFSEKDFEDEEKVANVIKAIKAYDAFDESEKKYPTYVYEAVRRNLGIEKYDMSHDDRINQMSRSEVLDRLCYYNNLVNYGDTIKEWISDIFNVKLED